MVLHRGQPWCYRSGLPIDREVIMDIHYSASIFDSRVWQDLTMREMQHYIELLHRSLDSFGVPRQAPAVVKVQMQSTGRTVRLVLVTA